MEELTQAIYRKASAKRTLASLKWIIADGFHIAVQV